MIVLDTNVISELMRREPDPRVMAWIAEQPMAGVFTTTLTLPPGIYEYKFVINGIWTLDPDPDRDWTQNGLGTLNSVLRVG